MSEKMITISIIGVGARGAEAYGRYIYSLKDQYKITSLCDVNEYRLKKYGDAYEIPESERFLDEDAFFQKKSDISLIISLNLFIFDITAQVIHFFNENVFRTPK